MQVGYHTDATTCMMFLTSMAGNPLCVGLAASAVGVEITWTNWALAAIVPGLISLTLGYSIALSELVVSPAMPSATARGGGVFYPIVRSLSEAFGS